MIKIHNLEKSFGNNHVLNGVNIEITRGECVCVIGPSGSGKSTFLRCINLLEQPDAGEILINGKDILKPGLDLDAFRANLGMVFQHFNLFPNLSLIHISKKYEVIDANDLGLDAIDDSCVCLLYTSVLR